MKKLETIKPRGNEAGNSYDIIRGDCGYVIKSTSGAETGCEISNMKHAYQVARDAAKNGDVDLTDDRVKAIAERVKANQGTGRSLNSIQKLEAQQEKLAEKREKLVVKRDEIDASIEQLKKDIEQAKIDEEARAKERAEEEARKEAEKAAKAAERAQKKAQKDAGKSEAPEKADGEIDVSDKDVEAEFYDSASKAKVSLPVAAAARKATGRVMLYGNHADRRLSKVANKAEVEALGI